MGRLAGGLAGGSAVDKRVEVGEAMGEHVISLGEEGVNWRGDLAGGSAVEKEI